MLERIMKEAWIGPTLFRKSSSDPEPNSPPMFTCRNRPNHGETKEDVTVARDRENKSKKKNYTE